MKPESGQNLNQKSKPGWQKMGKSPRLHLDYTYITCWAMETHATKLPAH